MLLMDIGNTRLKWGLWKAHALGETGAHVYDRQQLAVQLDRWFAHISPASRVVICSVATVQVNEAVAGWFVDHGFQAPVFVKSTARQAGVSNHYRQPEQLGVDRWMGMIAAHAAFDGNLCVISCGSALTLDVLTAAGEHQGGLIMPGVRMMRQSLLRDTAGIGVAEGRLTALADNTADAVYSGCFQLAAAGLSNLLQHFTSLHGGAMQCVITGGDGEQVARAMDAECRYDGNLILRGLGLVAEQII
jgi:type III pantothenate kinase